MTLRDQIILIAVLVLVVGVISFALDGGKRNPAQEDDGAVCAMDVRQCEDGSYVSRSGPNCEFASCPTQGPISTNTVELAIGSTATVNDTSITLLDLVEDSRCPSDVQCIQAGTVRVRTAINSFNRDFTFTLNEPQSAGNSTITLISVIPANKISTQTVEPGDYRFTFAVTK